MEEGGFEVIWMFRIVDEEVLDVVAIVVESYLVDVLVLPCMRKFFVSVGNESVLV